MIDDRIPKELIRPGHNDRTVFDRVGLNELAESIRQNGLGQPPTVRPMQRVVNGVCRLCGQPEDCQHRSSDVYYELVMGERRFRAMSEVLDWTHIPCVIKAMDDGTAARLMLAENVARQDLDPIDEAAAYKRRRDELSWTLDQIAAVVGKSTEHVKKRIELLELAPDIQHLVRTKNLALSYAQPLIRLDTDRQRIAVRYLSNARNPSLDLFKVFVNELGAQQDQQAMFDLGTLFVQRTEEIAKRSSASLRVIKSDALPRVNATNDDTTGEIIARYMYELEAAGHPEAAAAVGLLLERLLQSNWVKRPRRNLDVLSG